MLFAPAFPSLPASPALPAFPAYSALPAPFVLHAQHAAFRVKGRVVTERGEPIDKADVRLEAFYGYAAGTFSGPRKLSAQSNAKGEWSVGAMQPGVWLFEVTAPGYLPETVVLPIRILTTVSMGTSGMSLVWDLVLKPLKAPDDVRGALLNQALAAMREAKPDEARAALRLIPDTADADFLAGGGYRAALGVASVFVLERDFDSASRAFDAARNRTRDKDEQKFLSAAIGDLATIKVR
jgi:hypothetical protein